MENLCFVTILVYGFLTNLLNTATAEEPCYGCQLFNVRDKEQKSRRAVTMFYMYCLLTLIFSLCLFL